MSRICTLNDGLTQHDLTSSTCCQRQRQGRELSCQPWLLKTALVLRGHRVCQWGVASPTTAPRSDWDSDAGGLHSSTRKLLYGAVNSTEWWGDVDPTVVCVLVELETAPSNDVAPIRTLFNGRFTNLLIDRLIDLPEVVRCCTKGVR